MWCPPHARAHGHELGTEADPSAGNALTDGSSTAGSECTGQSCVLVMPSSVVPDKGRGRTGSKISSRGPTRCRMRQGWTHDCDLNLWSVQETQLEIDYLQYRTSPRKQQGYCWGGSDSLFWDHLEDTDESWCSLYLYIHLHGTRGWQKNWPTAYFSQRHLQTGIKVESSTSQRERCLYGSILV